MNLNKLLILFFISLFSAPVLAQPSDQQLAAHYFNQGEYEKALLYYEKLYKSQPSDQVYQFYLKTLFALEDFKEADKLIKKQIRRYPTTLSYQLDEGELYEKLDQPEKAREIYENTIEEMAINTGSILSLGQAFKDKGKLEYALQVFEIGKKEIKNYPFAFRTAELYGKMGRTEEMIQDYLEVVSNYGNYMVSVQNALTRLLDFEDPDNPSTELLRTTLLKNIQKNPNNTVYTEMLIWYFLQIQDYKSALRQAIALDKRIKVSNGDDVIQISRMCRSTKAYDVALEGYNYVIETYAGRRPAEMAKIEQMETLFDKVTSSNYTRNDLISLENRYNDALTELGESNNPVRIDLILNLAHIQAFYLYEYDKAIENLNQAINTPGINRYQLGQCKLKLGDVQLVKGVAWEASLNFMQVEKMFKEDVLGHEAKFRTAKVFYYKGQFEYAQSMLNVLKASTSKLIANDAMDLSLLITDNMGLDTTPRPMMLYAKADLLTFQNKFDEALQTMDTIVSEYGFHALSDEILYQKYKIAFRKQDYSQSAEYLQAIISGFPEDILGDNATIELARLYDSYLNDKEKAKEYYGKIIFDYEGSIYTAEARKRFRELGGSGINSIPKESSSGS